MKKISKLVAGVSVLALTFGLSGVAAHADDTAKRAAMDTTKNVSMTIFKAKPKEGNPNIYVAGNGIEYKVTEILYNGGTNDGKPVDLTTNDGWDAAAPLFSPTPDTSKVKDGSNTTTITTGADGLACISDLAGKKSVTIEAPKDTTKSYDNGLTGAKECNVQTATDWFKAGHVYKVEELSTAANKGLTIGLPFYVSAPLWVADKNNADQGEWKYDFLVQPKNQNNTKPAKTLKKVTSKSAGVDTYEWEVKLPITGDLKTDVKDDAKGKTANGNDVYTTLAVIDPLADGLSYVTDSVKIYYKDKTSGKLTPLDATAAGFKTVVSTNKVTSSDQITKAEFPAPISKKLSDYIDQDKAEAAYGQANGNGGNVLGIFFDQAARKYLKDNIVTNLAAGEDSLYVVFDTDWAAANNNSASPLSFVTNKGLVVKPDGSNGTDGGGKDNNTYNGWINAPIKKIGEGNDATGLAGAKFEMKKCFQLDGKWFAGDKDGNWSAGDANPALYGYEKPGHQGTRVNSWTTVASQTQPTIAYGLPDITTEKFIWDVAQKKFVAEKDPKKTQASDYVTGNFSLCAVETEAPKGYAKAPEPFVYPTNLMTKNTAESVEWSVPNGTGGTTKNVWSVNDAHTTGDKAFLNHKEPFGGNLPETGAAGVFGLLLLGGAFMIGGTIISRRRREEDNNA